MFNIIYCELLKLKRTYIVSAAVIGGISISILIQLVTLIFKESVQTFEQFSSNLEIPNVLLLDTILFSLMAGYVFSREFTDKTSSIVYTYPVSKIKIFLSKLIVVDALITLVYFAKIISILLCYYVSHYIMPDTTLLISYVKYNIFSLLAQFVIIPISILVANISKNLIVPAIYGILGTIATMISSGKMFRYSEYVPLTAPYKLIEKIYHPNLVDINHSVFSGILCFAIFTTICIYQYNTDDII